jgi:hypothetical protein
MCLLWGMSWVFISQKTALFIVDAVKTSNLTSNLTDISYIVLSSRHWTRDSDLPLMSGKWFMESRAEGEIGESCASLISRGWVGHANYRAALLSSSPNVYFTWCGLYRTFKSPPKWRPCEISRDRCHGLVKWSQMITRVAWNTGPEDWH